MVATISRLQRNDGRQLERFVPTCPVPTDIPTNASYDVTFTGGNLTQIDLTDSAGNVFRRTLTYSGGNLDTVSAWSDVTP